MTQHRESVSNSLRCLDLDAAQEGSAAEVLQDWLPRLAQTKREEAEIALRVNAESVDAFAPRLQRSKTAVESPMFLELNL